MRILYLGNNWMAWKVLEWLRETEEEVAGLVLHPPNNRKYGEEIIAMAGLDPERVVDGSQLGQAAVIEAIRQMKPDIGISVSFGQLLRQDFLSIMPSGCVNLHTSLLPYNRGANPNVWSIVNRTPAGVTLHYIDSGIDTGDIIAQRAVEVTPADTGETLYRKLERASVELFKEAWPAVRAGTATRMPQVAGHGTSHRVRDLKDLDEIQLDQTYTARYLIDLIRARTFPPYRGAYFEHHGRKVYLRLELFEDESNH
jgi:methionyl-tRNA formyltransferase